MELAELQSEVERRMAQGDSFNAVEEWIDALAVPVTAYEKSGLWLLAFALIEDRRVQRQLVMGYLGALTPPIDAVASRS